MKVGIQLYSLRSFLKNEEGYKQAFMRSKQMGAQVVQLSGGTPVSPDFLALLSEKYDLPICISHDSFHRLEHDLEGLVKEHEIYHCNKLGVGMMPNQFRTGKLKDIDRFIHFLNIVSQELNKSGMSIAYHNHWFEFDTVEGHIIYDHLIENTDPNVQFIPDTFWLRFANQDISSTLKKLDGRVNTLHLKDYKNKIFRAVGRGELDFKSILREAEIIGVENSVVELDMSFNPYKSMQYSMDTLKGLGYGNF